MRMRWPLLLPALLLASVLASARTASADPPGGGLDFGPRDPQNPTPRTAPTAERTPAPTVPDDPLEKHLRGLATWPDRNGVMAAESLLLSSGDVVPRLVEILSGEPSALQPGAAWVLGRLGEAAHVPAILRAAAKRPNGSRAEVFFEAALGLDADKTKQWLFSFLTLRRPVFRTKATDFLSDHVGKEDQRTVIQLLEAPDGGVRVSGLRLLAPAGFEDTQTRLVHALSDTDPEVARTASVLLALDADAPLVGRLNQIAREGHPRERAYATLSLVEVSRAQSTNPFEAATLAELAGRRGLLHPEKLLRTCAAIGLAYGALDTNDETLRSILDRTTVDVLIDAVGGEHFRDFSSTVESVFSALRRLSGLDLPATATSWATWWRGERDRFHARRPLNTIASTEVGLAVVRFEAVEANGRRRNAVFRSETGSAAGTGYILKADAFEALTGRLEASGIFESEAAQKPRADEHIEVTLTLMNQARRMVVGPEDAEYELLRLTFEELERANRWQRYRDTDQWPDAQAWWRTNVDLMEQAAPDARRQMLQAAIVHAFDDLTDDAARSEALDTLEELEEESFDDAQATSTGLTPAETRLLVQAAVASPTFGAVEERAAHFALRQPAAREVGEDLVESLASRGETEARELLAELLAEIGVPAVRDGFADARQGLRGAAARAAQMLLDTPEAADPELHATYAKAFRPGLEVLSHDEDAYVAIRALVGLQRIGAEDVLGKLETLYKTREMSVRVAVAEALGDLPAEAAFPLINLVLSNERDVGAGALRGAALRSLAKTGHPKAVGLLVFYMLNDLDPAVQEAAGDALADLGTEEARYAVVRALTEGKPPEGLKRARLVDVLARFDGQGVEDMLASYLEDRDPYVAQTAAFGLAAHNAAAAVPYLITLVREADPAVAQRAVDALQDVTSVRFDVTGHDLVAEQYENWYATARAIVGGGLPDRAWFRDALRRKGYDAGALTGYVIGEADPMGVPVLVRALRDDDPVLRRNAALALHRLTGLEFGEVLRTTSTREAARVADRWARWWTRVSDTGEAGR